VSYRGFLAWPYAATGGSTFCSGFDQNWKRVLQRVPEHGGYRWYEASVRATLVFSAIHRKTLSGIIRLTAWTKGLAHWCITDEGKKARWTPSKIDQKPALWSCKWIGRTQGQNLPASPRRLISTFTITGSSWLANVADIVCFGNDCGVCD